MFLLGRVIKENTELDDTPQELVMEPDLTTEEEPVDTGDEANVE